ncbi:MAG: hypothetical protein KC983_06860 [Phycisphaerales bacterium]|nr:hypothetical protein [Phycisphaerales bacterium]
MPTRPRLHAPRTAPLTFAVRLLLIGVLFCASGCQLPALIGAIAQNEEYQSKKEVLARYPGLEGKIVAVLVNADLAVQYDYPQATPGIAYGISGALATHANCKVIHPDLVTAWQYRTPNWHAMAYGDMADSLNADRVVYVDLLEYRLTPPGNRFNWEGVAQATVSVLERDGFDPDTFADSFTVTAEFPKVPELTQYEATADQITRGLQQTFVQQVTWLFFDHIEPKYPDKYRPELDPDVNH